MKTAGRIARRLTSLALTGALTTALGACSTAFTFGVSPRVEDLARLQRGVSTSDDVRRILGEPRGRGQARLSIGDASIWLYDHGESASGETRVKYLMVFMRQDAYDGYLWLDMSTTLKEGR